MGGKEARSEGTRMARAGRGREARAEGEGVGSDRRRVIKAVNGDDVIN